MRNSESSVALKLQIQPRQNRAWHVSVIAVFLITAAGQAIGHELPLWTTQTRSEVSTRQYAGDTGDRMFCCHGQPSAT